MGDAERMRLQYEGARLAKKRELGKAEMSLHKMRAELLASCDSILHPNPADMDLSNVAEMIPEMIALQSRIHKLRSEIAEISTLIGAE